MNLPEKSLLLATGFAPFLFLLGNATRRIRFEFLPATFISCGCGALLLYFCGLGRHPRVSSIFVYLFLLWPLALILAKAIYPSFSWKKLWLSVPVMSWFTVNTAIAIDYPISGGGGGFAMLVNLCIAWFYLVPVFGIFQLLYLLVMALIDRLSKTETRRL